MSAALHSKPATGARGGKGHLSGHLTEVLHRQDAMVLEMTDGIRIWTLRLSGPDLSLLRSAVGTAPRAPHPSFMDRMPASSMTVDAERLGWIPMGGGVWKHRTTGKLMQRPDNGRWPIQVLGGEEAIKELAKTGGGY